MSEFKPIIEAPGFGRVAVVETGEGDKVNTAFFAVDAPDLIVSNLGDGSINPAYPQELQPRDRTSLSSKMQVLNIANDIRPEQLADHAFSGKGSPIIGPDNVVESGNGRALGILRAYGSGNADNYRQYIIDNAEKYGLDAAEVDQMRQPVLVRVRLDDIDRVKFAIDSNKDVKSAVPDKAMMEAANGSTYFSEARDVDDLINLVKYRAYGTEDNIGQLVGDGLWKLLNGVITYAEYMDLVNKYIPPGSDLRDRISTNTDAAEFFYGVGESRLNVSMRNSALAVNVLLNGKTGLIVEYAKKWEALKDASDQDEEKRAVAKSLKAVWTMAAKFSDSTEPNYAFYEFWRVVTGDILGHDAWYDVLSVAADGPRRLKGDEEYAAAYKDVVATGTIHLDTTTAVNTSARQLEENAIALGRELAANRENLHQNLYRATDEQYQAYIDRIKIAMSLGRMGFHSVKKEGIQQVIRQFSAKGKQAIRASIAKSLTPLQNKIYFGVADIIENQPADEKEIDALYQGITIDANILGAWEAVNGEGMMENTIKWAMRLAGGKISTLKRITRAPGGERASASRYKQSIQLAPNDGPEVLAHEIGHHFEFSNPNLLGMAVEYLRSRQSGTQLRLLKSLCDGYNYRRDEKAIADSLSEPYIGKVYGGQMGYQTSTEVFSMGFQYLYDQAAGAESVMNRDGLLEFVTGAIKGVHSGKY